MQDTLLKLINSFRTGKDKKCFLLTIQKAESSSPPLHPENLDQWLINISQHHASDEENSPLNHSNSFNIRE